ncbi:increased rDNA silencing protein 4 [Diaporthe eres]|uniref:EH domain-containing protein n=1 Tax=Diaporthe vaccinii TaxID=105482 RepID=A0ABR4EYT9_9PEZI|nr:increased rDNA silencing protein 4 [Diaporthe eres]
MHASGSPQSSRSNLRPVSSNDNAGPHKLTPQEAALRGAFLAFSKQQQQQQQARRQSMTPSSNNAAASSPQDGGALVAATSASRARSPTGSVSSRQGNRLSRQGTGAGNGRISRQTTGNSSVMPDGDTGQATEHERERLALFLSSPGSDQSRGPYLLPPGGRAAGTAADPKSTSFIAATLAASRSVSPGSGPAMQGGGDERTAAGRPRLGEPATIRRKPTARTDSPAVSLSTTSSDGLPDTAHLPPANSLISMFEHKGDQDVDPVKDSPGRALVNRSKGWPLPDAKLDYDNEDNNDSGVENIKPRRKPVPKTKPKPSPKPKPKIKTTPRDETPPPPVVRRANTEIVSPKPRRPDTKPKLEFEAPAPSTKVIEKPSTTSLEERKRKPEPPKPKKSEKSENIGEGMAGPSDYKESAVPKSTPPTLPARSSFPSVAAKPPAPKKRQTIQRLSLVPSSDGQDSSRSNSPKDKADGRPLTRDSMSSNDTFVSASSTPTRAESPPVFDPASRTLTPKALPPRSASARPVTPAFSVRQNLTGSSQLPIASLSDAMMAGSLASARHTPVPMAGARTPPPVPPSRRKGGARKAASRAPSPHHMKKTLRDHRPKSDDEDARRPHHKKGLINSKKHTHHEGSRRRWREEITERERKRYEAVWASNRGLFLVPLSSDPEHNPQTQPHSHRAGGGPAAAMRDRSHEELSEHVASVVVRDIWSRSRLPEPELAEVWDLVYGLGQEGGPRVRAALGKSEFVVGTWLIDQRLRGRKIPPRVSDSVWSSAKGLWSAARNPNHHHRREGKGKGV